MSKHKPIALWAVPRSISTAFERIFVERDDFEVFHEPFSIPYYYGEERKSDRFADEEPHEEQRYEDVMREVLAPSGKRVFIKDMAYYVDGLMDTDFVRNFSNTFLIREPSQVIASLSKIWPDFTLEETGYEHLHRMYGHAVEAGEDPVVIDAHDFSRDTDAVVSTYCQKLGIPFESDALTWEKREVPEWEAWDEWHEDAQKSTEVKEMPGEEVPLPSNLQTAYEFCLPYYEELYEKRMRV